LKLIFLLLLALPCLVAQTDRLNLSHDLVPLKIAAQNMAPDTTTLDARPLLEAGVQYAQSHGIPLVTCDPGAYYLLTGHPFGTYAFFNGLHDLTLDLADSDLYFQQSNWNGMECTSCQNVQFQNFTLDSLQLPFTQLRVTSVDTVNNRISYAPLPGWEPATNFNTVRNPTGAAEPLYAFVFRNGAPLRQTSRIPVQRPVAAGFLQVTASTVPWEAARQLASIQPGDVVVLQARSSGPALGARDGSAIVFRNIAVYSSGQVGVSMETSPNSTVDQVQVVPRPGTDRLIGSNADGITAINLGRSLTIRRSRVKRTGDDGISPNVQSLGVVTGQPGTRQVAITRTAYRIFADGTAVQFMDNKTGTPAATAHIVSQVPAYSTALPDFGSPVTLTLDADVPKLAAGDPMIYADAANLGAGLLLENNLVEDGLFARGISVWGVAGGTVQGNVVRNVAWSGLDVVEALSTRDWMQGPPNNLAIRRNVFEQFTQSFGSVIRSAGAITIGALDANQALIANSSPMQNIAVDNNFLSTSAYTGIWMQNVAGGSISGNTLMNVSAQPGLFSPAASLAPQLATPIVVAASTTVTPAGNTVDSGAPVAAITSAVSFSNDAIAPDSWAAVFGNQLSTTNDVATALPFPAVLDDVRVTITDSTGTARAAGIWFISAFQINFLVPSGLAPGAAVVTVTSGNTVTGKGGVFIDSLAPALFAADGSGTGAALGAAVLARADGSQVVTPLTQPIDLGGPGDAVVLVLYATGIRNAKTAAVYAGDKRVPVLYAGDQGTFAGLDQINVTVPSTLRGAGTVTLRAVVDGISSNPVTVQVR
jgi:uncharacterized protein (TIGR03437 family)